MVKIFLCVCMVVSKHNIILCDACQGGSIDLKALIRREGAKGSAIGEADIDLLRKMDPLKGESTVCLWECTTTHHF